MSKDQYYFVAYAYQSVDRTGFGDASIRSADVTGPAAITRLTDVIKQANPEYTAVVILNWKPYEQEQ